MKKFLLEKCANSKIEETIMLNIAAVIILDRAEGTTPFHFDKDYRISNKKYQHLLAKRDCQNGYMLLQ